MMRTITSLLLALVLALTSQSMAVARGASAPAGQMVICTGTGPMVVYVDAQGQPTEAPVICSDAAMQVLVAFDPPVLHLSGVDLAFVPPALPSLVIYPSKTHPTPPSRAPPLDV